MTDHPAPAAPATPAVLTAESVVDGRTPQTPAPAPDGRLVAYVLDGGIWLAGDSAPRRVAAGASPGWSADSGSLFFLAGARLHRLTVADGTAAAWGEGITGFLPLADPALVALLCSGDRSARGTADCGRCDCGSRLPAGDVIVAGRDEPRDRLRLLDLRTGEITTPGVFGGRHVTELRQRPGGGPLAVLTRACADSDLGPRTNELHLYDPATGATRDLGPAGADARSLAWWPEDDGWHLGHLALTPPDLHAGTAVFDLALTGGGLRNRTAGLPLCPTGLHQTAGAPLIVFADGLDTTLARLDPAGPTVLSRHPGRVDHLTVTPSGDRIAVLTGTRYQPPQVHAGPPAGPLHRLTDTRPDLAGVTLGVQERLHYRAADGLDLDGLLVLPAGRNAAEGPFPLVTIPHGGPYDRYADRLQLFPMIPSAQWLATAGYAVFLPNPRGGLGHGHTFAARVTGRVGREEWTDITTGIDLLVARGIADPDRLGIAGWSHGGFLAAWAVGQTHRFRAAIVGAGVTDWGMLAATGENGRFEAALGGSTGWEGVGPHPHDAVSPISYASRIRTPVLILHGAEDTNVPLGQAVYLHRALRHYSALSTGGDFSRGTSPGGAPSGDGSSGSASPAGAVPGATRGVEHQFVIYPREGHVLRERAHQLDLLHRTRAWFDRWLQHQHR